MRSSQNENTAQNATGDATWQLNQLIAEFKDREEIDSFKDRMWDFVEMSFSHPGYSLDHQQRADLLFTYKSVVNFFEKLYSLENIGRA